MRPLIGVTSNSKTELNGQTVFTEYARYMKAIELEVDAATVMIPAFADYADVKTYVHRLDAILFTGSASNIHPSFYNEPTFEGNPHDMDRDTTNINLIKAALDSAKPLFFICRGLQELNVALGGSLHQKVNEVDGFHNHSRDLSLPYALSCGHHHYVTMAQGGMLAKHLQHKDGYLVNSIHNQAINRLADTLLVEATSRDDGLIEAVSLPSRDAFTLAVQWHPEHAIIRQDDINKTLWRLLKQAL